MFPAPRSSKDLLAYATQLWSKLKQSYGLGTYTTKDGQTYKGAWLDDKLINTVEIKFPNGNQYYGELKDSKFNGEGMFVTNESLAVMCNFVDNRPAGHLLLLDFKGKEWHGYN
ncbi:unnamed protein product [Acanthoscelides obtectus]|uniref:Uncharacterized protein n=1 Tax=Acanthoscelides obtectus TaxID=200917 RepID=A0A9P0MG69_ACAOB|nr:unnamed protein product [Acanthoscelides obtectus]CAK1634132.1 hypothetical protein AOBTE_LOCUS8624 [Acanthoscelides obtectus]